MKLTYDVLIERIRNWAQERTDIRLAVVIGSRARTDKPADIWSDLDLLLFTAAPQMYLSESSWLSDLGPHHLTFLEPTAVAEFVERRVLFDEGLDVDFIPLPMSVLQTKLVPEIPGVLRRGYRILLDKDGLSTNLAVLVEEDESSTTVSGRVPTEADFLQLVNDFLYHAVWSAKKLCRKELWTAKMCCDGMMKRQVLSMLEWHHQELDEHGDTWHEGRFLDSWANPQTRAALGQTFAVYETASIWRAIENTVRLFGRLGNELAGRLGYAYPSAAHEYIAELLETYKATSDGNP